MFHPIHHHAVAYALGLAVHVFDKLLTVLDVVNLLHEVIAWLWPFIPQLWA